MFLPPTFEQTEENENTYNQPAIKQNGSCFVIAIKKANSNFNPATALIISQTSAEVKDQTIRCMKALTTGSMALKQQLRELVQDDPSNSRNTFLIIYFASRIKGAPPLEGITMTFALGDLASSFIA